MPDAGSHLHEEGWAFESFLPVGADHCFHFLNKSSPLKNGAKVWQCATASRSRRHLQTSVCLSGSSRHEIHSMQVDPGATAIWRRQGMKVTLAKRSLGNKTWSRSLRFLLWLKSRGLYQHIQAKLPLYPAQNQALTQAQLPLHSHTMCSGRASFKRQKDRPVLGLGIFSHIHMCFTVWREWCWESDLWLGPNHFICGTVFSGATLKCQIKTRNREWGKICMFHLLTFSVAIVWQSRKQRKNKFWLLQHILPE